MPMMLCQEVVKVFRHLGRDVSLTALLAHVCNDTADHQELFTAPKFHCGLPWLQRTTTKITPIDCIAHLATFRVL
jgi:hypothetical protein